MPKGFKWLIVFIAAIFVIAFILPPILRSQYSKEEITYSIFLEKLESAGEITRLVIQENSDRTAGTLTEIITKDGKSHEVNFPLYLHPDLPKKLESRPEINIATKQPSSFPWFALLPILMVAFFLFFILKLSKQQANQAKSIIQKHGKALEERRKERFTDVAGIDEAREELEEIVDFLKNPEKYQRLGARIPRGVLLIGPPGTGKTLLAKAIAGEANVRFFPLSGSEFVEMFVGVGASRVRDLFNMARQAAPCIVFIDEIDAVGRHRGSGLGSGHDEREQTLNQIFVEMDGFNDRTNIIVIAATNRPDILDPGLLRPGRFDRKVVVDKPDIKGREAILKVHTKDKPLDNDVNIEDIARALPGATGADLENITNEAAILAAKQEKSAIGNQHFLDAIDKILMGKGKKLVMDKEDKKLTAYHEVGHLVMSKSLPGTDPVRKVSIVARDRSLGQTLALPEKDRYIVLEQYLLNTMKILLGGRLTEEIFLNTRSTGAEDDLRRATEVAQKMVCHYGMSKLGPRVFGSRQEEIFLGREMTRTENISPETLKEIDDEVTRMIDEAYQKARELLSADQGRRKVERFVNALLEKETLDREEIDKLWNNKNSGA